MPPSLLAVAIYTLTWQDLTPPASRIAAELGLTPENFPVIIDSMRARNAARLREGEIDHLIFYMLQSPDFTAQAPIDPAIAAAEGEISQAIRRRVSDLVTAFAKPADERQKYLATLVGSNPERFLEEQLARVLRWIREKEIGCRTASSPQACIAALYATRGHSSDTSPQSMAPVRAAFEWLREKQPFTPKRILIVGPGSDFAPRTAFRSGSVQMYQPRFTRELAGEGATIECVDLNPRVVRSAAVECAFAEKLDIATERIDRRYDAIIATNVLLYLDQKELLLALHNVRAMLAPNGVFIHNDARFETHLFGRAAGLPVVHFETVTLDAARRPALIDRFVIHSPAAPKL